ncbi:MAG: DNA-nicking Smr family endonuclease [Alphaproteobacteria bacterium]|jgi:DNA-nicking Smr family endonuclease
MDKKVIVDADWAAEIEDVEPLKKDETYRIHTDAYEVEDFNEDEETVKEAYPHEARPNAFLDKVPQAHLPSSDEPFIKKERLVNLFSAVRASISPDVFSKLKKGFTPYEAKLDLHGLKEDEAWGYLNDFLVKAYSASLRCVLIVHGKGKGYGQDGQMGIIKANICGWLENSSAVLAYHTAQAKHGGSGAVYVLIRKNRQNEIINEEDLF